MPSAPGSGLISAIALLWSSLARRRRIQFFSLIGIMVVASVAEIFSLGLIVPFLAALTDPARIAAHPIAQQALQLFGLDPGDIILWLAIAFCAATLLATIVRIALLYANTRFSFAVGADLSYEIYRRTLHQPYRVHISRNTSEIIDGVIAKTNLMMGSVLGQLLSLTSATFLLVGILGALLVLDAAITIAAATAFVVIYGSILLWSRTRMRRDSHTVARESPQVIRALQEGLGGIRDVLLDNTQETFAEIYRTSDRRIRAAQGRMTITVGTPRFVVEGLGMIFIAMLAVVASDGGRDMTVIPVLGAVALGAQRLLPVVQQIYASITTIRGSQHALSDVLVLIQQPISAAERRRALPFTNAIEFRDVSFRYAEDGPNVIERLNLRIAKGARVGVFGRTGGGKSTLLDLLMGLLLPSGGEIAVDGAILDASLIGDWQANVAHVPQAIYLSDATVAENIAFGTRRTEIDMERVRLAANRAQLAAAIEDWPARYDTLVGERGVRLSGGQRQRIGIARALYKSASVIILDEATSALDNQTEKDLMAAVDELGRDLTIIMVAHRLTTLRNCDVVVEIANGKIVQQGKYEVVIAASQRT